MLEVLLGGATAEKVLFYLVGYGEGYAREISECFEIPVSMVQKQLIRFEKAGILVSRHRGKIRLYTWNPRYAFKNELMATLEKALKLLPASEKKKYFYARTRPRRTNKPL